MPNPRALKFFDSFDFLMVRLDLGGSKNHLYTHKAIVSKWIKEKRIYCGKEQSVRKQLFNRNVEKNHTL